jgi:Na+/proline symporter
MFTENIIKQFKPDLSDKAQLLLTRISLVVSGVLSLYIAMTAKTIYELAVLANTCILVGMVAPYIIGMYWKKANHIGAVASFLTGTLSWIMLTFYYYRQTFPFCEADVECATWDAVYIASTPAFIISIVVFIVVSLLTHNLDRPKPLTDINGQLVDMRNPLGIGNLSEDEEMTVKPVYT